MRRALLAGAALLLTGCTAEAPQPVRPVTETEARAAVQRVVELAADGRFDVACREAHQQCGGLSPSGARSAYAPGADRPPTVRCTFGLPAHLRDAAWGDGHVVVLEGRDARDRPYVSQQLVLRVQDEVRVHEPAFWLGIAYSGFGGVRGSAWSSAYGEGATAEAMTAQQTERAVRSCDDTAGYLAEVAPARS